MKKQILSVVIALAVLFTTTTSYAAGKNADGKNYTVHSVVDGYKVVTAFNKNGHKLYSIQYYTADKLAKNIMDVAKRSFDNYYISGMEKVEQPGFDDVYIVHLENAGSAKTLRIVNGETELVNDFKKI